MQLSMSSEKNPIIILIWEWKREKNETKLYIFEREREETKTTKQQMSDFLSHKLIIVHYY